MSPATQNGGPIGKMKYAKRLLRASTALWLLGPVCLWAQTQPSRQAISPGLLRGGELIVESRNFAVATPAGEWEWSVVEIPGAAPSRTTYVCTETAGGAEVSVTLMDARLSSGSRFVAGFKNGLQESLTTSGLTVVSIDVMECSIPAPGSYHCQWHAQRPDGTSLYGYGYLTGGAVTYLLQHATTDSSEPPEFTQFARTFRLLHAPWPGSGSALVGGYILLLGSAWGVAGLVNRLRGRLVLNGGTLGALLVLIMTIVLIVLGNYAGLAAGLPSQTLGGITGYRMGQALIPLLVAVLLSRHFRKRKKREDLTWGDMEAGGQRK